jgi:phosphoribosylformylglycinamidine synthase
MVSAEAGATVELASDHPRRALFNEAVGRAVVETTDPETVQEAFEGVAPVTHVGSTDDSGTLTLSVGPDGERLTASHDDVVALRSILDREMD